MLRTYKTCNPTVGFSKYEFNNKLLGSVTLLRVTPLEPKAYVCMYVCMHAHSCQNMNHNMNRFFIFLYRVSYHIMYPKLHKHLIKFIKKL